MNYREIVEVTACVARYGDRLVESGIPAPESALEEFRTSTRGFADDWLREFRCLTQAVDDPAEFLLRGAWPHVEALLQELFVVELPVRLTAALFAASDVRREAVHADPFGRRGLICLLQARREGLMFLATSKSIATETFVRINQFRQRMEAWCDLLLGSVVSRYNLTVFAVDEARSREFGREQADWRSAGQHPPAWNLVAAGVRLGFPSVESTSHRRRQCLRRIAAALLSSVPADTFDTGGLLNEVRSSPGPFGNGSDWESDDARPRRYGTDSAN